MPLLASIDVGSNTVRLLAAKVERGRIVKEVLNLREITRLYEGLRKGGCLKPEARERTLRILKDYSARLDKAGVKEVSAVATEALRLASDAADFIAQVEEETGLRLEVITGEEEARRTLLGVKSGVERFSPAGPKLVVDIGGGSTELIFSVDWKEFKAISLPFGAVTLYERYLAADPPTHGQMSELLDYCFKSLRPLQGLVSGTGGVKLIGTAGTITTLAAVDLAMDADAYDPDKVTGHRIGRGTVERLLARFAGLSLESRKLLAGLEPGREDIILSGTALLGAIMDVTGAEFVMVCDWGLREGNLLDYLEKKGF